MGLGWCMAVIGSLTGIKLLAWADEELPKIKMWEAGLFILFSLILLTIRDRNAVCAVSLYILCGIAAYTDAKTKHIYDVPNILGFVVGIGFTLLSGKEFLINYLSGMVVVGILLGVLYLSRCMKSGDIHLLLAVYPFMLGIIREWETALIIYLLTILTALVFSLLINLKKIIKNWNFRTCYAPYHMAATWLFLLVYA